MTYKQGFALFPGMENWLCFAVPSCPSHSDYHNQLKLPVMNKIKKHIAVIEETNLKKIDGTDKYRLVLSVSFFDNKKPHLLNYEIDSLVNLQHKFKFSEVDLKNQRIANIEQRKCIVNDDNNVYSFGDFI